MSKHANLAASTQALSTAIGTYSEKVAEMTKAIDAKDHKAASEKWKEAHDLVIALKHTHNSVYSYLNELRPKVEKKAKAAKNDGKAETETEPTPAADDTP